MNFFQPGSHRPGEKKVTTLPAKRTRRRGERVSTRNREDKNPISGTNRSHTESRLGAEQERHPETSKQRLHNSKVSICN